MSNKVNSGSLKSNKSFIGIYRAIVTRCPSYEPDPDNENKIQVCIPSYHGEVDDAKVGSGSNPGVYPWARMCFPVLEISAGSSDSSDATDSGGSDSDEENYGNIDKYIFVGDSRTQQMKTAIKTNTDIWSYKGSEGIDWLKKTGIPNIKSHLKEGAAVISWIGVNDCYSDFNNDNQYAKAYVKYIDGKAKEWKSKNIPVIVLSVGPIDDKYNIYSKHTMSLSIQKYNEYLKANLKVAKYIDISSVEFKTTDGLHYDTDTYKHVYKFVKNLSIFNNSDEDDEEEDKESKKSKKIIKDNEVSAPDNDDEDDSDDSDTSEFKPRTTDDGLDGKYWTTDNPFYPTFGLPNCTCYAWGRAYEITGSRPKLPTGDAGTWVESLNGAYPVSKDNPQLGDVCCWKGGGNGGHVAVIEAISDDGKTATISESAWNGYRFHYGWTISESSNWSYGGGAYTLQGFIHIGDYSGSSSSSSVSLGDSEGSGLSIDPYPKKDEVVWVSFEGGDIRYPIIVGSMTPPKATGSLSSGDGDSIDSGTLAKLAADIIIYEEVGATKIYDSVIGNDNGGLSIGLLGFHNDRARDVIKSIYKIDKSAVPSGLAGKLNNSWDGWIISKDSTDYNNIKTALRSSASKQAQDQMVIDAVQGYIDAAKKLGITDNAALIYAADLHNQGGGGALEMCYNASSKPITLDSLYKGACSTYMGNYMTRRNRVYEKVKKLQSSGKLDNLDDNVNAKGQANKTIAYAKKEIGYKAADHGGQTKFGQWYGTYIGCSSSSFASSAWCAMFTQWCMYKAGVKKSQIAVTASAGRSEWAAKGLYHDKNEKGFKPKTGDLIVYSGGCHVGLVEKYKDGVVHTIEGNTGASPGCVARHEYRLNDSYVMGFNRPKYKN